MQHRSHIFIPVLFLFSFIFSGCIHEYPTAEEINPTDIDFGVELELQLHWDQFAEQINFETKAQEKNHRLIIEMMRNGQTWGRDEIWVSDDDFNDNILTRRLPFKLKPFEYQIGVWYDRRSSDSGTSYDATDISEIKPLNREPSWEESQLCGYAYSSINLTSYKGGRNVKLLKQIGLLHAGARFELVSTDIKEFIRAQTENLEAGETYTITLDYGVATPTGFNILTGKALGSERKSQTGRMRIPFIDLQELTIASGFVFCDEEDILEMSVTIHNSARVPIIKTPPFRFTIRRGALTRVFADFLSEEFTGSFIIDNKWEGEIIVEL